MIMIAANAIITLFFMDSLTSKLSGWIIQPPNKVWLKNTNNQKNTQPYLKKGEYIPVLFKAGLQ